MQQQGAFKCNPPLIWAFAKLWSSNLFPKKLRTRSTAAEGVPMIWGESLWNPNHVTLMPQKPPRRGIVPKPTFSRSTCLHTYTCAGVDGCVKGRKFASELTRLLLNSIRFFFEQNVFFWIFVQKNIKKTLHLLLLFASSCILLSRLFTLTGKCLTILMF